MELTTLQNGRYRIESILGQGGFGITYRAVQTSLMRTVAIKEFFMKDYCERAEDSSHVTMGTQSSREMVLRYRDKFEKEARTLARLEHPHIVRVIDVFQENNTSYYVMEYAEGMSLKQRVDEGGALSEAEAANYIHQVADALKYLHSRHICHLDVKPANILTRSGGDALLADFGLAKQYDEEGGETSTTPVGRSKGYAPPEQYMTEGIKAFSPETDVYALGATLYFLLTGNTPPESIILGERGLDVSRLSPRMGKVVQAAMQPKRTDRILLDKFEEMLEEEMIAKDESSEDTEISGNTADVTPKPIPPIPSNYPSPHRPSAKQIGIAAALVASLCGIIFYLSSNSGSTYDVNESPVLAVSEQSPADTSSVIVPVQPDSEEGVATFSDDADVIASTEPAQPDKVTPQAEEAATAEETPQRTSREDTPAINAEKEFELGVRYYNGDGVTKNLAKAIECWTKAASQEHAGAQHCLGVCYHTGTGVVENPAEAVKWYTKAANQNYTDSQVNLGQCYFNGTGVKQNLTKAVEWWTKAAEQKNAIAQYLLAQCYDRGEGVTENLPKAVELYTKAAKQGHVAAEFELAMCYYSGSGVTRNMAKAVEWFTKAADHGHADAQFYIGRCYFTGIGVTENKTKGIEWYTKAANQGNAAAQRVLGLCYLKGEGIAKDEVKAIKWLARAAQQEDYIAQNELGLLCYHGGDDVRKDLTEAVKWFRKAAEQGFPRAQFNLGRCYENGEGVAKDLTKAVEWYTRAAQTGYIVAKNKLKELK